MTTRVQRFAVAVVAALVVMLAALGFAAPAQAHNYLVSSTPKAGEVLTVLPAEFSITTNDILLNINHGAGFALQVQDANGRFFGDGCVVIDGPTLSTDASLGAPGDYTVTWQVISTDGHTVSDTFAFSWKPADAFAAAAGNSKAPDCHGTLKPNAGGSGGTADSQRPAVNLNTLETVLWIGGAVIAVGLAVAATLAFTGRRKKS
jgi:methionine-rich copper-binding protein CopC